ncbi:MAG: glucosamine-6-phosphate deaminase [Vicinamibacterales bacterium]
MDIRIFDTPDEVAAAVAQRVADALAQQPALVLGLPAGRTPVATYAKLCRLHAVGKADFGRASAFNLDEFAGIAASHPGSFRTFMDRRLFAGVNLSPARIHFLNGAADDLDAECERYETVIQGAGGIDLQLLGIGSNAHIGFNEPGDALIARTHRVRLADSTRRDNAALFGGDPAQVPLEALSMGMGTILKAGVLALLATGERKAASIEQAVRGPISTHLPASFLQLHRRVELYLDRAAASRLTGGRST